jgi:hypothetical protein
MRRALVLVVAVTLLAGCSAEPTLPAPMTDAELMDAQVRNDLQWWDSMFPGEPPPAVSVERWVDVDEQLQVTTDCLKIYGIDGIEITAGGWSYQGDDPAIVDRVQRAQWECHQRYPLALDATRAWYLSEAQLDYIYRYFESRLVPCLRLEGYEVRPMPDHATFMETSVHSPAWNPYYELTPMPNQGDEWLPIAVACPPPVMATGLLPGPREY